MAEEHDTAIFAQGKRAKEAGDPVEANPFDPTYVHQADSWAAGWAEGVAPAGTPLEARNVKESDHRDRMAKRSKEE